MRHSYKPHIPLLYTNSNSQGPNSLWIQLIAEFISWGQNKSSVSITYNIIFYCWFGKIKMNLWEICVGIFFVLVRFLKHISQHPILRNEAVHNILVYSFFLPYFQNPCENPCEASSRSRIFLISLVYVFICACTYMCNVSWPNEKWYRPEIWHILQLTGFSFFRSNPPDSH